MINFRFCTDLTPGDSKVDRTLKVDQKKIFSWILPTFHGSHCMYPRELIIKLKVVYNIVSHNFYLDKNTVRWHWKHLYSDLKNHQICDFGQLWRLPEREQCKIVGLSFRYKLLKISFLTTFITIKTLYDEIWNIYVRFVKSLNFSNLETFGDSWGENDASWKVDHGVQCIKWHLWQLLYRS